MKRSKSLLEVMLWAVWASMALAGLVMVGRLDDGGLPYFNQIELLYLIAVATPFLGRSSILEETARRRPDLQSLFLLAAIGLMQTVAAAYWFSQWLWQKSL